MSDTSAIIAHYRLVEKLGEGGMGVVWRAVDMRLDREVALKFLSHAIAHDAAARDRFVREARAASAITHPNVATIYAIEEHDGDVFIAMELVEGRSLRSLAGSLTVDECVDIARQVAEGLAAAHDRGIVHRDIKGENIIRRDDGRAVILDFGLAHQLGVSSLTRSGSTLGTVAYMAPEQIQDRDVDARSDVFSLGVVLYELLAGRLPWKGRHEAALLYEIVHVDPASIEQVRSDVPAWLAESVAACLQKDPTCRVASARALAGALAERHAPAHAATLTGTHRYEPAPDEDPSIPLFWLRPMRLGMLGVVMVVAIAAVWLAIEPEPDGMPRFEFRSLHLPFAALGGPGMSRDGNWIAVTALDTHGRMQVHYMNVATGQITRLTSDSAQKIDADISPDGSTILFTAQSPVDGGVSHMLRTVSVLGGDDRMFIDNALIGRWAPDGRSVAFVRKHDSNAPAALWVADADGTTQRMLVADTVGTDRVGLAWSPKGKSIAWLRNIARGDSVAQEIVIVDVETRAERALTSDGREISEQWWAPGGLIYFASNRSGPFNIWAIPSEGGEPRRVTTGPGRDIAVRGARGGRRLVYLSQPATASAAGASPRLVVVELDD